MASITDACEDLLLEVFVRLPVKTLSRFQLVCKRWKSLISSTSLNDLYLSRVTRRRSFKFKIDTFTQRYPKYDIYDARRSVTFSLSIQRPVSQKATNCRFFGIVGAIQGVICFEAADSFGLVILWNPVIHKHVFVPIQNLGHLFFSVLGFGFRSSNNDFKLLRVSLIEDDSVNISMMQLTKNYEVFSVKGENWRKGVFATDVFNDLYMDKICPSSSFINGNIHLVVADKMRRYSLLVFDCEQEEFSIMKLPDACMARMSPFCSITLWRYDGKLSVLEIYDRHKFAVWVMKEYGVSSSWYKRRQGSWFEQFQGYGNRRHHMYPFLWENLEESMCLADLEGRVLSSFNSDLFPDHDRILIRDSDLHD